MIDELFAIITERKAHPQPGSYTNQLLTAGENKILKKINEEATEVIIAAKAEGNARLLEEMADLFYHSLVLLASRDLSLEDVKAVLRQRHRNPQQSPPDGGSEDLFLL